MNNLDFFNFLLNTSSKKDKIFISDLENIKDNCKLVYDSLDILSNVNSIKIIYCLNSLGFVYGKLLEYLGINPNTVRQNIIKLLDIGIIEKSKLSKLEYNYMCNFKKFNYHNVSTLKVFKFTDFGKMIYLNLGISEIIKNNVQENAKKYVDLEVNNINNFKESEKKIVSTSNKYVEKNIQFMTDSEKERLVMEALNN